MEQARQLDVAERIAQMAAAEPYERALLTVRGYAAGLLDTGYPRDVLQGDLVRARDLLEARVEAKLAPEEAEDVPVDVADFLVGWCASFMRL